jgi:hypothetical protein
VITMFSASKQRFSKWPSDSSYERWLQGNLSIVHWISLKALITAVQRMVTDSILKEFWLENRSYYILSSQYFTDSL